MVINVFVLLDILWNKAINNAIGINKNASKIIQVAFLSLKCFGIVFVSLYDLASFSSFYDSLYKLIANNCWIIHNTCSIFSIFTTSCSEILNIIFFTYLTFFTFTSTFIIVPPLICITFSSIKFTFTFTWYMHYIIMLIYNRDI